MKIKTRKQMMMLYILLFAILVMGIGYSAINSITGTIKGLVVAEQQNGVFITDVQYVSGVDANQQTSEIKRYIGTMMQSTIKLSSTNANSEITYKVTVYNSSENRYPFLAVLYDETNPEGYDNPNITFTIGNEGFKIGDFLEPKEMKDIYMTFKYRDGKIPADKNFVLNSYINFRIEDPHRLVLAGSVAETGNYLNSTIAKNKIEKIKFEFGRLPPDGKIINNFDASEKKDKSIIGYYTDTNGNGLYELTFVCDGLIAPNVNGQCLFHNLTSLKEIDFGNFTTYGVTDMHGMFYNCKGLTTLDVSKFDTSSVTNMQAIFAECSGLTTLDVSKFDTSNVINMRDMFYYCSNLTTLELSKFNTSKVTNMIGMFNGCSELTSLNISNFNTNNVIDMSLMFCDCSKLTTLDVSKFNTSKVTNIQGMFKGCSGLTTLDVSNFNTSNVTDMNSMFYNCSSLTALDVSQFNTSNVVNMRNMFADCSGLTTLDVSKFNTSNVRNMSRMFYNCKGLTKLDVTNFNTSNVTNMEYMFNGCSSITALDVSKFNTGNVTNMEFMFCNCSSLTTLDVSNFNTSKVTNMDHLFRGCNRVTILDVSKFDTSNVENMFCMFFECSEVKKLDLSNFNTSKVKLMSSMFYRCKGLTTLDVSGFDTRNVERMQNMFGTCIGLTKLDLSGFDTSNVTSMAMMFRYCSSLTILDLSSFNTSKVTDMGTGEENGNEGMFYGCSNLTTIYVSKYDEETKTGWTTSSVTNSEKMFTGCTNLVGGKGTKYDANHIDKEYARIDEEGKPGYLTKNGLMPSDFDWDSYGVKGVDYEIVQDDETVIDVKDYKKYKNWKARLLTSGKENGKLIPLDEGEIDIFAVGGGGHGGRGYYEWRDDGGAYGDNWYVNGGGGGGGYTETLKNGFIYSNEKYSIKIGKGGASGTAAESTIGLGLTANGGQNGSNGASGGAGGAGGSAGGDGKGLLNAGTGGYPGYTDGQPSGKGQGRTTREFGEPTGKLYSTGGNGYSAVAGEANTGNGGGGNAGDYNVTQTGYGGAGGSGIIVFRNARGAGEKVPVLPDPDILSIELEYYKADNESTLEPQLTTVPEKHREFQEIKYEITEGGELGQINANTGIVTVGTDRGVITVMVTVVDATGHKYTAQSSMPVNIDGLLPSDFDWDSYGVKGVDYEIVQDDDTVIAVEDYHKYVNWKARLLTSGKGPLIPRGDGEIDVFLVGGGGNGNFGGGGGGYTKTEKRINLTFDTKYTIKIGGAGGTTSAFGYDATGGASGGGGIGQGARGGSGGGAPYGGGGGSDGGNGGGGFTAQRKLGWTWWNWAGDDNS